MASKPKRKRKKTAKLREYLIRKARGRADGKSLSQARGHARAVDLPSTTTPQPFKRSEPLENALKLMKTGRLSKGSGKAGRRLRGDPAPVPKGQHHFPQARPSVGHLGHPPRVGRHGDTAAKCAPSQCRTMRAATSAITGLRSISS